VDQAAPKPAPAAEPEPEAAPEPAEAPEEEVKAAALYKNNKHKELKEGGPFDPKAEGNHPSLGGDSNLVDKFLKSSTLWVCYSAAHKKHDFLEFVAMGNSIAELKDSLDGSKQMFYLVKCYARDVKNNVVSQRIKLMRITQLGSRVPVMKRRFKTKALELFKDATSAASKDVQDDENMHCDWMKWMKEIRNAGGAHQPSKMAFGPEEVWHCG